MSVQDRGRWIVIAIICITLVGHTVFVVLPAAQTGAGLAGTIYRLWLARWVAFCIVARIRLGTLAFVWVVCHRVAVDSAPSLRVAVCIRNFESDSPDHRGITAVRHAERCFILGRPTSCRIFCTDSDSYSNAYSFTDSDSYSNAFTNGYAYAGPDHAQRPGEKGGGNKYGASQMEASDLGPMSTSTAMEL